MKDNFDKILDKVLSRFCRYCNFTKLKDARIKCLKYEFY